jgi:hypothetical protein
VVDTSRSHLSGGVSLGDLDGDGASDLVIAGGTVAIFINDGTRFALIKDSDTILPSDALSTLIADLDGDGLGDIVIGSEDSEAMIIWGGPWLGSGDMRRAEITSLLGHAMTTGVLAGNLDADATMDLVLLGYETRSAASDTIPYNQGDRSFLAVELPDSGRKSLAGQIADIDGDGVVDIWVTRDLGWRNGPDSLYSRDLAGEWRDIAPDVGVAMEVDGMGVTLADLTGDGVLDGYVSDLGGNEFLERSGWGFVATVKSGALRIRPPGADEGVVSSSWRSGAADVNLDGVVDLVVVHGGMSFSRVENKISGTRIEIDDPPAILIGLGDGTYTDSWPSDAIDWVGAGRGVALWDVDSDGDTDMVITRLKDTPVLLLNDSAAPAVTLRPVDGCSPYGAVVSVATAKGTVTQLLGSFSFAGGHAPGVSIGHPVPGSQISVKWPTISAAPAIVPPGDQSTVTVECRE